MKTAKNYKIHKMKHTSLLSLVYLTFAPYGKGFSYTISKTIHRLTSRPNTP